LQNSCTQLKYAQNEGGNGRFYTKNKKNYKYCLFLARKAVI